MRCLPGLLLLTVALGGCARMIVHKDPGPEDVGVRFYRPKPYLFLGPAAPAEKSTSTEKDGSSTASRMQAWGPDASSATPQQPSTHGASEQKQPTIQAVMKIEFLPDYSEEYSIKMHPGIGVADLNVSLQNGWNLTSVGAKTDQGYAAIIGSVAQLAGAAVKPQAATYSLNEAPPPPPTNIIVEGDVPLGYYEAVLALNECGRRELIGWRYVGFMPYLTCPVKASVVRGQISCNNDQLYALVFEGNTLRMKRMPPASGQPGICPPLMEDAMPLRTITPEPIGSHPASSRSASASPARNTPRG